MLPWQVTLSSTAGIAFKWWNTLSQPCRTTSKCLIPPGLLTRNQALPEGLTDVLIPVVG